jgi:hypothetical protein
MIVRERPAGGGRSGSIRRKREEEHCRRGMWDHTLLARAGDISGEKI